MDDFIAILLALLCVSLILRLRRSKEVVDFQMATVAAFSVGYFALPVWFKELSVVRFYPEARVAVACGLFAAFLACVSLGVGVGRRIVNEQVSLATPVLDALVFRRRRLLTFGAFAFYMYYYFTQQLTSYSSENFETYFSERNASAAIIAALADVCLGWIAYAVATAWKDRRRADFAGATAALLVCTVLLALVGQRLAFLSPIAMLMACLAMTGQVRRAVKILSCGVALLLLISPIAVAIRQAPPGQSATQTFAKFNYGDDPFETVFQSIIDRGDLIYVAIEMLPRIEEDPLPGPIYYSSVLVNPVPRALFPGGDKPYPLSTTGDANGELSILAWKTLHSSDTGSLTAFGGLVAFRELRWAGVLLNGLSCGVLFVFLARWLGGGGALPKVLYANLFVSIAIKKVPPSFWETINAVTPLIMFIVLIWALERSLRRKPGRISPNQLPPGLQSRQTIPIIPLRAKVK